jgi:hypothetical protein
MVIAIEHYVVALNDKAIEALRSDISGYFVIAGFKYFGTTADVRYWQRRRVIVGVGDRVGVGVIVVYSLVSRWAAQSELEIEGSLSVSTQLQLLAELAWQARGSTQPPRVRQRQRRGYVSKTCSPISPLQNRFE